MRVRFVFVFFVLGAALPWAHSNPQFLNSAALAAAKHVHLGKVPCELGAFVTVTAVTQSPGYFDVQTKYEKYRMHPVESRSGAIRLEDPQAGTVWLQLANKSMLMNQKLGARIADACMSPDQVIAANKLGGNQAPNLLEIDR